jgi:hypothetical protein
MTSTLYLEQYLDSLEPLPGELRRNFTLMHGLDHKNRSMLKDIDASSDEYLRKARELSTSQRGSEMEKIQKMFKKAKEHGDDKVSIAIQTYEMVDKHIRRLDSDLAKFEAEMREQGGRISQTETEDESASFSGSQKKKKVGRKAGNAKEEKAGKKRKGNKDAEDSDKGKKKKGGRGGSSKDKDVAVSAVVSAAALLPGGIPQEVLDMPVDPNEPTYCLCQQVSYGEMIGCDNNDCPIEWFHFGCMELTTKPKGKWYCPKCLPLFKKKK